MTEPPVVVGRYLLHRKIARGGMATIHIARLIGDVGFSRIVAAKRMHPDLAEDNEFVAMFLDEARIASRVQHRNVVSVVDVVTLGTEVMLVQEYVHGVPLCVLLRAIYETRAHVPVPVAAAIACQVLAGLHAAHETVDELGTPLDIVHRDVSPQNVLIATDGTARLLDFGVAKAALSAHVTRKGTFKGKLGYSSPEQIRGEAQRQSDIYSLAVVLWELIVGHRLHAYAQSDAQLIAEIMAGNTPSITSAIAAAIEDDGLRPAAATGTTVDAARAYVGAYRWGQLEAIEPVIRKALDVSARRRWQTAQDMEEAIAAAVPLAPPADVAAWLRAVGKNFLDERDRVLAEEEASWRRNGHLLVRGESGDDPAPSTANEPDGVVPTLDRPLWTRIPIALFSTLLVALVASVAFLARDLDSTVASPVHDTAPAPEAPPAPKPRRVAAGTALIASEPPVDEPPPPHPELPLPATKPTTRVRTVRPAPPRSGPVHAAVPSPPRPAAASLDCSTPFYFEGRKKIFKPGCL